jgi:hypothetical protein
MSEGARSREPPFIHFHLRDVRATVGINVTVYSGLKLLSAQTGSFDREARLRLDSMITLRHGYLEGSNR